MKIEIRMLIVPTILTAVLLQSAQSTNAIECEKGQDMPKASLLEKAEKVNVMPVALQSSGEGTDKFEFNKQQQEMADLWDATVARSQDIQFVIQKLMPNSTGKPSKILMHLISTAAFGGMGAGKMMMPNRASEMNPVGSVMYLAWTDRNLEPSYPALGGQSAPYSLPLMATAEAQYRRKARLNETEAIMLYNIVRATAERLKSNYDDYSRTMHELAENHETSADKIKHVIACRASLVSLAGDEAVNKLDENNGFTKLIERFSPMSR